MSLLASERIRIETMIATDGPCTIKIRYKDVSFSMEVDRDLEKIRGLFNSIQTTLEGMDHGQTRPLSYYIPVVEVLKDGKVVYRTIYEEKLPKRSRL